MLKVFKPIAHPLATIDYVLSKYLGRYPRLYFAWEGLKQIRKLKRNLTSQNGHTATTQDSKASYNSDGERPIMLYEQGSRPCFYRGHISMERFRDIQEYNLRDIYEYIELEKPKRILEVGCGNAFNLLRIKEKYGDELELWGMDIAKERIQASMNHYGDRLNGIKLFAGDITEGAVFKDGHFDMVFTRHCLEQITYNCEAALREIIRLSNKLVILIEPLFELGNWVQRLHMLNTDHNRVLLKTINQLNLNVARVKLLDCMANPVNPSGIVVINKVRDE